MNNDFRIDFAIRNFVWFVIFVIVCLVCVINVLLPQIQGYKKQAIETKKAKIVLHQLGKDYHNIESQLKTLVVNNYGTLVGLYNENDESKIQAIMQESFTDVEVKKVSATKENDILTTRYRAVGYADSTQMIGEFMARANAMPYFARVELPLKMERDEKGGHIRFEILIDFKNSIYQEHQIILDNQLRFHQFRP